MSPSAPVDAAEAAAMRSSDVLSPANTTVLKQARKLIEDEPRSNAAAVIADLVTALESEASFRLERLYVLKLTDFELASDLITEWRLARYYAKKGRLLDLAERAR